MHSHPLIPPLPVIMYLPVQLLGIHISVMVDDLSEVVMLTVTLQISVVTVLPNKVRVQVAAVPGKKSRSPFKTDVVRMTVVLGNVPLSCFPSVKHDELKCGGVNGGKENAACVNAENHERKNANVRQDAKNNILDPQQSFHEQG
jgi:hypothetical protein